MKRSAARDAVDARHRFVWIDDDGSARELTDEECAYLATPFELPDSGRPYIKARRGSRTADGRLRGFLERSKLRRGPTLRWGLLFPPLFVVVLVVSMRSARDTDPWTGHRMRARDFLDAAWRGDSVTVARMSGDSEPVQWAMAAKRNSPELLGDAAATAGTLRGWRMNGDTAEVEFEIVTDVGPCRKYSRTQSGPRKLRMTFAGPGESARVLDVHFTDCY
jgi:hypothetical protein